jgi:DNA mismatch endonuclease (patch repair protein)
MNDIVDSAKRSMMMSGIRSRNTKPELALRKGLHAAGFRYRLHGCLPGSPDIVLPRYRAVIFVHGCFWHRHPACSKATTPATRAEFWAGKFASNVERDARTHAALRHQGWRVGVVWECALTRRKMAGAIDSVAGWLRSDQVELVVPALTPELEA